jgi:hypothetical protein
MYRRLLAAVACHPKFPISPLPFAAPRPVLLPPVAQNCPSSCVYRNPFPPGVRNAGATSARAGQLRLKEDHVKKFMVLYKASSADFEKMMKSSTPEQQQKGMEAWGKWMQANQKSIVDGGAPLGKTKRVDQKGVSDAKNDIGGYSVVQADSPETAAKIFSGGHPHLQMMPGAWIEVTEIMPMPGM